MSPPLPLTVSQSPSDAVLMRRAQRGDEAAFGIIVRRHTVLVQHTARSIVRSAAEDVAQQTFLSAWTGRNRFDPDRGSVRNWLCGIARNRAIDLRRREVRQVPQFPIDDTVVELVCPRDLPADVADARADARAVREAVGRLGEAQRTVITLAYFGELSQSEIQERTQAPLGTVKSRARLGLSALRADLAAAA